MLTAIIVLNYSKSTQMPPAPNKNTATRSFELRHLRYFCALVDEKNFERAAARLGIAQPGLSQQIMALEAIIGSPLIDRSRRSVQLTQSGEVLYRDALKILAQTDAAMVAVKRAGRGEIGQVSIGYVASAAYSGIVFESIRTFRAEYPDVAVNLTEMELRMQLSRISEGLLDMGFIRWPAPMPPGLTSLIVKREPLVAVLNEAHALANCSTLRLDALKAETFLTPRQPADIGFHRTTLEACRSAGFEPDINAHALDFTEIASRVAIELGVALVPKSMNAVGLPGICYVDVSSITTTSDVAIAFRKSESSLAAKSFVALCRRVA